MGQKNNSSRLNINTNNNFINAQFKFNNLIVKKYFVEKTLRSFFKKKNITISQLQLNYHPLITHLSLDLYFHKDALKKPSISKNKNYKKYKNNFQKINKIKKH